MEENVDGGIHLDRLAIRERGRIAPRESFTYGEAIRVTHRYRREVTEGAGAAAGAQ
jgi:hypothetical protein